MTTYDALNGRKPDTSALEFTSGMEALERAEQLVGIRHLEPRAVVLDKKNGLAVLLLFAESDLCLFALRRKLPCVAQQVTQHDSQKTPIAVGQESVFGSEDNISIGVTSFQLGNDCMGQFTQVNSLAAYLAARNSREFQHVVNQLRHLLTRAAQLMEMVLARLIKFVLVIFQQYLAEAVDMPQGCPQVVRNRVREGLKFFVGGQKLGGAFDDTLLEGFIQAQNRFFGASSLGDVIVDFKDGPGLTLLVIV